MSGGGGELGDSSKRNEAKGINKCKRWMKDPSAPWIPSLAAWTSASGLPSYLNFLVFPSHFQKFFISKKKRMWHVFWVIYCKIWHICLPLLGQPRNEVKPKQTAGQEDFHTRRGITQWDVPLKGSVGQVELAGRNWCSSNMPTSPR